MAIPSRYPDRVVSIILYVFIAAMTLLAGEKILNNYVDSKFYNEFLLRWEVTLRSYEASGGGWPEFNGSNHVEYMDNLTALMDKGEFPPPRLKWDRPYVYRINKMGESPDDIFILVFYRRIIIYGIREKTFNRMDVFIDGAVDKEGGRLTGSLGSDRETYIADWRL